MSNATSKDGWCDFATRRDLSGSRGNGPFGRFLGVILHVNQSEHGTSADWFASDPPANKDSVTPTFQVFKDGSVVQFLPLNWQPWCQIDGNFNYGAIETAGLDSEPLTDAQVSTIGRLIGEYRDVLGMSLAIADQPGQRGLGTHQMGGAAWGGHPCPGSLRAGQRSAILAAVPSKVTDWSDNVDEATFRKVVREEVAALLDAHANDPVTVKAISDWHGKVHSPETMLAGIPGYVSIEYRQDHPA
jgi:hypothetical protein